MTLQKDVGKKNRPHNWRQYSRLFPERRSEITKTPSQDLS